MKRDFNYLNKSLIIVIYTSLLTNFFGLFSIYNFILLGIVLPFTIMEYDKRGMFNYYLAVLFLGLFINFFSSYFFREQSIYLSFRASAPFYYILFYFVLRHFDFHIEDTEKAILILSIIFCICYLIQFVVYPTMIFSGSDVVYGKDVRIRMVGQGISSLGYFYGLNKLLCNQKRVLHIILLLFCFSIIFLMGFRTMMVMILLFSLILIIRVKGFNWRFIFIGTIIIGIFFGALQFSVFNDKIYEMISRNETQNFFNSDYIRVIQYNYFTKNHFKNNIELLLGSGIPDIPENGMKYLSEYGRYMLDLSDKTAINYVDLGLLSLSWVIGVLPVIAMIAYSIKAYLLKVNKEYLYLGNWFAYLLFSSFTTAEFFRVGNFVIQAIVLFIIEKANSKYEA